MIIWVKNGTTQEILIKHEGKEVFKSRKYSERILRIIKSISADLITDGLKNYPRVAESATAGKNKVTPIKKSQGQTVLIATFTGAFLNSLCCSFSLFSLLSSWTDLIS